MFSRSSPLLLAHLLLTSLLLASLSVTTPAYAQTQHFTPQQLQEDLRIAQQALEEAHGGIYRYKSQPVIDQQFSEAQAALQHNKDALGFYRVLKPAVASIACGHTTALLPLALKDSLEHELLLPLDVKILQGKVYVLRDFSPQHQLVGREIVRLNGVPTAKILQILTKSMHGDGNIPTMRAIEVGRAFKELLFTMMDMRGQFTVVTRNPKTKSLEQHEISGQELAALKQASVKLFPQDQDAKGFLSTSFFDGGKIAYLKIDRFIDNQAEKDGARLFKSVFTSIREQGSHTLIIDVRDNGGGKDALGKILFSYLIDQPFTYYDSLTIKTDHFSADQYAEEPISIRSSWISPRADGQFNFLKHPNLGVQEPSAPSFRGRVLILINGGSFSTTSEFLTQVHTRSRATFIGEESGGAYFGSTSGNHMMITLPNTKVRLVVPLLTYQLSTQGPHAADRGVMPDYPVQRSIKDYLEGHDPEWELALKLAKQGALPKSKQ